MPDESIAPDVAGEILQVTPVEPMLVTVAPNDRDSPTARVSEVTLSVTAGVAPRTALADSRISGRNVATLRENFM